MGEEKGYLALVLHAHLPFIKHPEYPDFLEEDWFYEAMVETYIPLLNVFENLTEEGTDFRLTMSLTPPLCNMMEDPLLISRFRHYLNQRVELSQKELNRTQGTEFEGVARMYFNKFRRYQDLFENRYHGHVLEGFKKFQDMGKLEIITCCATHGYLPLMVHKESVNAQIKVAANDYRSRFGRSPRGIWLAECAYNPGDDKFLRDEGIRDQVSVVVGGSIRNSADLLKAIALGADACYIATSALLALGCHLCRSCQTGKCNWGIATQRPELVKRLNPDIGSQRLINLVTAWDHELKEMMGGMGINSIEALRGNRLMLRGLGLTQKELNILGIKHAGE